MKELTIEQKAKRYDEALKVLHKYDGANIMFTQDLKEEMFPELKESEDEKTRKEIIRFIRMEVEDKIVGNKWLAWLEKQGEKEPVEWSEKNEIYLNHVITAIKSYYTDDKGCENPCREELIRWLKFIKPHKQWKSSEEQKDYTSKVEPKFKAGDWVVRTNGESFCNGSKFAQIQSIDLDEEMYYLDTGSWLYLSEIRLWSIKDAKDGDVLVSLSKMHPFIFNGHYDEDTDYVYAYCGISDIIKDDSFYFDKYPDEEFKVWDSVENVRPATRDQRNLLFSKMKDSGYEWDSKKKELIKTEQV